MFRAYYFMATKGLEGSQPVELVRQRALLSRPPLLVLHVNDSTDDQVLFQAACKKANVPFQWHVAESADRGISYLQSLVTLSRTESVRWPDLVVLDIVMPGGSGFAVLEHIRGTPELRALPVVIFTGMPSDEVMEKAYQLGANSFHEKPVAFEDTVKLVSSLYRIWSSAKRPSL
jgi:CheY-like chemotaxis protein